MKPFALLSPYLIALILTLVIEGILCWLFLKNKSWLKFTCLVNLFTNPLVNFIYTVIYFALANYSLLEIAPWILLVLEILIWLSEAWLFCRFSNRQKPLSSIYKALLFSFVLNAASYLTGLLLPI